MKWQAMFFTVSLTDAPRRLVWEVRVGVGGVDVESVPKVEPNSFSCSACVFANEWFCTVFYSPRPPMPRFVVARLKVCDECSSQHYSDSFSLRVYSSTL